eukprot:72237-Pleurochrysis_carterae.AAC.3
MTLPSDRNIIVLAPSLLTTPRALSLLPAPRSPASLALEAGDGICGELTRTSLTLLEPALRKAACAPARALARTHTLDLILAARIAAQIAIHTVLPTTSHTILQTALWGTDRPVYILLVILVAAFTIIFAPLRAVGLLSLEHLAGGRVKRSCLEQRDRAKERCPRRGGKRTRERVERIGRKARLANRREREPLAPCGGRARAYA